MLYISVAQANVNSNGDTEVYSPGVCCVCPRAGDSRACMKDRVHSRSVANITEPEVVLGDCVG